MAFHPVRFPLDIALGAQGGPERRTDIVTLSSGNEARNSRWARSRRRFNAGYGVKSLADARAVLDFFEERRGRLHGFLWRDGLDHASGDPVGPLNQVLEPGDGEATVFQLTKRYGGEFDPYLRPITRPVAGSVRIGVDGVEAMAGWSLGAGGLVTFAEAPADGAVVTAGFLFDVPVRFDTDRLDITRASFDAADIPSIPVVEILE